VEGVLMDLDGTSVRSESFWVWIIERTTASLLGKPSFELEAADMPYVAGHSVSEHLEYCLKKYASGTSLEEARKVYYRHTHEQMRAILEGRGKADAFTPVEGLREFLLELKAKRIKIGLVTSGLYEKAWPEIVSAFQTMKMGNPEDFYDAIITAGYPLREGQPGTLGELCPKPHPWLYAETCTVGLGIPFARRNRVVGIEDSGAGVCSIRLAGFTTVGLSGGNILESGTRGLCQKYADSFTEILEYIDESK
jgi:beta-phosphoglucomutase-like phosphatase (HAD superfamily)